MKFNYHLIQSSFDYFSKAFDKVRHQGLLFKLKTYGVEGNFLRFVEIYLDNWKQRVILDGQCSSWKIILFGVPQGFALGPLLFLNYTNNLPNGLNSICKISADETPSFSKVLDKGSKRSQYLFTHNKWMDIPVENAAQSRPQ